jgi:hypothetical protein
VRCFSHPKIKAYVGGFCVLFCAAKLVALALGGSAVVSTISTIDFRLPLILAGWSCIGLATYLMMRANRELAAPAACRSRKTGD